MSGIVLSSSIRSNLLALQNTTEMQATIQNRLATGKKVNSALDNPSSFFTATSLNRRASDLGALLDGMSQGIKTLEAADNAMKSITKTVESMQANIRQARSDKSFKGESLSIDTTAIGTTAVKNLTFSGGAVGTTPVNVALNTTGAGSAAVRGSLTGSTVYATPGAAVSLTINATAVTIASGANIDAAISSINSQLTTAGVTNVSATKDGAGTRLIIQGAADGSNNVTVTAGSAAATTATGFATTATTSANAALAVAPGAVKTVDELVTAINSNSSLSDKVRASNDGGKLRVDNLSTESLSVVGASSGAVNGGTGSSNTTAVGGNDVRKNLITQFNDLRTQLDKLANDGSYNGTNLVKADKLKINFNETGTSNIEIQAKNVAGTVRAISLDANSLDLGEANGTEFSSDASLDARLGKLNQAMTTLQTQSSSFGAALTTVQTRQDFTKNMINTLQGGADDLTLADGNEEGANLLALNTRQQLAQTALSLSSQASQAVLRLF